jgi:hypothetical protein
MGTKRPWDVLPDPKRSSESRRIFGRSHRILLPQRAAPTNLWRFAGAAGSAVVELGEFLQVFGASGPESI